MTMCENCFHVTVCKNLDFFNEISSGVMCEHYTDKNLIVRLPCELGSTVWAISKNSAEPFPAKFRLDDVANLGKKVFLSKASALKKLKGARRNS